MLSIATMSLIQSWGMEPPEIEEIPEQITTALLPYIESGPQVEDPEFIPHKDHFQMFLTQIILNMSNGTVSTSRETYMHKHMLDTIHKYIFFIKENHDVWKKIMKKVIKN